MAFDLSYLIKTFWLCVKAIPVTLEITIVSFLLAFIPALLIALCRIHKLPVLEQLGAVFVSFIRGTPIVLQILIVYSLCPSLLNALVVRSGWNFNVFEMNPIVYAFVVFGINTTDFFKYLFMLIGAVIISVSYFFVIKKVAQLVQLIFLSF